MAVITQSDLWGRATATRSSNTARLEDGLSRFGRVQRVGSMLTQFAATHAVRNFEDASRTNVEQYGALFRHLLGQGVYLAPSPYEALFVSLAHGVEEIDRTIEAAGSFFEATA